jgi:hypothetical protein
MRAHVALTGASNGLPSEMSFTIFAISRAQSILSIGRSDSSVEVKVDVEGVTFCEGVVAGSLEPFFGLVLRRLAI